MKTTTETLFLECLKAVVSNNDKLAKRIINELAEAKAEQEIAKVKDMVATMLERNIRNCVDYAPVQPIRNLVETLRK